MSECIATMTKEHITSCYSINTHILYYQFIALLIEFELIWKLVPLWCITPFGVSSTRVSSSFLECFQCAMELHRGCKRNRTFDDRLHTFCTGFYDLFYLIASPQTAVNETKYVCQRTAGALPQLNLTFVKVRFHVLEAENYLLPIDSTMYRNTRVIGLEYQRFGCSQLVNPNSTD